MQHDVLFTGEHVLHLQREIKKKQQQLADSDSLLQKKKAELVEKREDVRHLMLQNSAMQSHVDMLKKILKQITEEVITEDDLSDMAESDHSNGQKLRRNPMEMIKPQFKSMHLGDIVEMLLIESKKPMTIAEISRIIYDTDDKQELARARNSLSAELRSGAAKEPPRWLKRGRATYVARSQLIAGKVLPSSNSKGGEAYAS